MHLARRMKEMLNDRAEGREAHRMSETRTIEGVGEDAMNKKRLIIIVMSAATVLIAVVAMLALLAETHPYPPSDWRYGVSRWRKACGWG